MMFHWPLMQNVKLGARLVFKKNYLMTREGDVIAWMGEYAF